MDTVIIIVFGIFGLSILVLVHELGHYIAARLCGVQVEKFSIGFGKKLVGFTHKGITYQISWFLFGGYCKLKGEMFKPDVTEEEFQSVKTEKGSFLSVSALKKIIIVIAGPLANILFAILIFSIIAFAGYTIRTANTKIILMTDYQFQDSTPITIARDAGLKTGDTIISINGKETKQFNDLRDIVANSQGRELSFTIKRGDNILNIEIAPQESKEDYISRIGVYPWIDPIIEKVKKGKAADRAGFQEGDKILTVNGKKIEHEVAFNYELDKKPQEASITYERNGEEKHTTLHLSYNKKNELIDPGIYFKPLLLPSPKYNLFTAFLKGFEQTIFVFISIIKSFGILFTRGVKNVSDAVAGPVRITQMIGTEALVGFNYGFSTGMRYFFQFICLISVLLGFMNLLPIPALDGGHVVLALIMNFKKNMGPKFIMNYQLVGISVIVLLTILAFYSDISHFFKL